MIFKRIIFFVLTIVMIVVAVNFLPGGVRTAAAETITTPEGIVFNTYYGSISDYTGDDAILNIPSQIEGVDVVEIQPYAFFWCNSLTHVTIPNSVIEIGNNAFEWCQNLESVTLPNKITEIESKTFIDCDSLIDITIPESVIEIGWAAFSDCDSLTNITIPNGVTGIWNVAFSSCDNLSTVTIPASVSAIGYDAFRGCSNLIGINVSADNIHYMSVDGSLIYKDTNNLVQYPVGKSLTSYSVPTGIEIIGAGAFYGCENLLSVTIQDSTTQIRNRAFLSCSNLETVNMGSNVNSIGDEAFSFCESLVNISLPNSVTSLGSQAFAYCSSLPEITIPGSIKSLGNAFVACGNLTNVVIENGVDIIGTRAFYSCGSLNGLVIPSSVTKIEEYAFAWCTSLSKITIPSGVGSIGIWAFSDCHNLDSLTIENGVGLLGARTFSDCDRLTEVTIPSSVLDLGYGSFSSCDDLTNVILENGVLSIDAYAFEKCNKLENIIIPDSVTSIDDDAFSNCNDTFIIFGVAGSEAEAFALRNGYNFSTDYVFRDNVFIALESVTESEFGMIVIDGDTFQPVDGAAVQIDGEASVLTDENGSAAFSTSVIPEEGSQKDVQISKTGYNPTTFPLSAKAGEYCIKYLYKDTGEPRVLELFVTDTGYDILNNPLKHVQGGDDGVTSLTMVTSCDGGSDIEYRLIQDGEIVARSDTATFNVDFETDLKTGYKVFAQVADKNDGVNRQLSDPAETGMLIFNPNFLPDEDACKFSIGEETSITIPASVPLIGGKEISSGLLDFIPFTYEMDENGKFKFSIGVDANGGGYKNQKEKFKSAWLDGMSLSDIADAYESELGMGFFKAKARFVGYGEGEFKEGLLIADIRFILEVEGSFKKTIYTALFSVPAYVQFGGGIEASGSCSVTPVYDSTRGSFMIEPLGISASDPEITFMPYGTVGIGAGIPEFTSIGGEVKVGVTHLFRPASGYRLITLDVTGTLKAYVLFKEVYEEEVYNESLVLDESYDGQSLSSNTTKADTNWMDLEKSEFIPRAGTQSYTEGYQLESGDIVAANTYQNAMPKMIEYDGKSYLFWLTDNVSRDVEDRSMLVYAVNDGSGWSAPTAIEDDGTADAYFDVAEGTDGLHVVWHDSAGAFESDATLDECMAAGDISYAFIDTVTSAISTQSVTREAGMDTLPKIANTGSSAAIVWISNSDNNALMNTGVNTIHKAEISGGEIAETDTIDNIATAVNNLDIGYLSGTATIAYVLDTDNDYSTFEDKEMYVKSGSGSPYNFTNNDVMDSNACFATLGGTEMLFWYADGNIYYVDDPADTPVAVFHEAMEIGSSFNVINGSGTDKIVWNEAVEEDGTLKTVAVAVDYSSGWTRPYLLADLGSGATVPTGYIDTDCQLAYLISNGDGVDLVTQSVASQSNIVLDKITYSGVAAGSDLAIDLQVSNIGMTDISSVDVMITRNGMTVHSEKISADIAIGMSASLSTTLAVPADVTTGDDFSISVSAIGESDSTDNTKEFHLGYSDLVLSADYTVHDGDEMAIIYVANASSFPADATLIIRQNDAEGTVISQTELTAVSQDSKYMTSVNLSAIYGRYEDVAAVFVQVVGVNDELYALDNEICLRKDEEYEGDENLTPMDADIGASECSRGSADDGEITIDAVYGSGYYECSIDNAATWQAQTAFTGLPEGVYDVYVRDVEDPDNCIYATIIIGRYGDSDLNNDGVTDLLDVAAMAQEYGGADDEYDLNMDGIVNLFDIVLLSKDLS